MSEYTDREILCGDIDWFILINNMPFHVASDGGMLPEIIRNNKERNEKNFRKIKGLKSDLTSEDLIVNSNLSELLQLEGDENYYAKVLGAFFPNTRIAGKDIEFNSLDEMQDEEWKRQIRFNYITQIYTKAYQKFALKGFVSMDKSYLEGPERQEYYHWVVRPKDMAIKLESILSLEGIEMPSVMINETAFNTLIDENHPVEINLVELIDREYDV